MSYRPLPSRILAFSRSDGGWPVGLSPVLNVVAVGHTYSMATVLSIPPPSPGYPGARALHFLTFKGDDSITVQASIGNVVVFGHGLSQAATATLSPGQSTVISGAGPIDGEFLGPRSQSSGKVCVENPGPGVATVVLSGGSY